MKPAAMARSGSRQMSAWWQTSTKMHQTTARFKTLWSSRVAVEVGKGPPPKRSTESSGAPSVTISSKSNLSLDFEIGTRGWGYILENEGVITKDELDACERLITEYRKSERDCR